MASTLLRHNNRVRGRCRERHTPSPSLTKKQMISSSTRLGVMDSLTHLPRRVLVLCCLTVLQLFSYTSETAAFAPRLKKLRPISSTGIFASVSVEQSTKSSTSWLQNEIEHHENTQGSAVIDDQCVIGPKHVLIYDTTLRDGTQGESVSASCDDKLKITHRLNAFQVDFIEAGWPGSNPKDAEFFDRAKRELSPEIRSRLVAFGSTRRKGIHVQDDPQIQALLDSEAPTVCIVAKAHVWQVTDILRATPEENLEMIRDSVSYLSQQGRRVFVDLEHFYDGHKYDSDYALNCCEAAADAGAKCLVLCDTNGGSMPWEVEAVTRKVVQYFDEFITVGVHTHNDCGMAVANSLSAIKAGAGMVQGTINGIGERTGNADLCSIVPSLALHMDSHVHCRPQLSNISTLSRFVDEILNRTPNHAAPYVGTSAFAHKGGLHVAALERSPMSYQHVDPSEVGNEKRVLISELSGRQNIMGKLKDAGVIDQDDANTRATAILNRVKRLESKGYTFEGAEASVHLMILHATTGYCPPFRVLDYSAQVYDAHIDSASRVMELERRRSEDDFGRASTHQFSGSTARATIKVRTLNLDEEVRC